MAMPTSIAPPMTRYVSTVTSCTPKPTPATKRQMFTEPQAGEGREDEGAEARHPDRLQRAEHAQGLRREQPALEHAGRHIGGEEQIVEFEHAAAGNQRDDRPQGTR